MIKLEPTCSKDYQLNICGRKLSISIVFTPKLNFKVHEDTRLNSYCYCVTKISSKYQIQQTKYNHSGETGFIFLTHLLFLVVDTTF